MKHAGSVPVWDHSSLVAQHRNFTVLSSEAAGRGETWEQEGRGHLHWRRRTASEAEQDTCSRSEGGLSQWAQPQRGRGLGEQCTQNWSCQPMESLVTGFSSDLPKKIQPLDADERHWSSHIKHTGRSKCCGESKAHRTCGGVRSLKHDHSTRAFAVSSSEATGRGER